MEMSPEKLQLKKWNNMTDYVRGSILIDADLTIVQVILLEHRYIKEWEKGFNLFKELHVSEGMKSIVHWDIEHDIDHIFNMTEKENGIFLELVIGDLKRLDSNKYTLKEFKYYRKTVLNRIKAMSEKLQDISNKK